MDNRNTDMSRALATRVLLGSVGLVVGLAHASHLQEDCLEAERRGVRRSCNEFCMPRGS
jgi:hypothetical protein